MLGACADGITTCHSGAASCDALASPSSERCDGVDNDCNGMTDEGDMLCPAGLICEAGSCVPPCVEGGCFENQTCTPRGACVDDACLSMTCPAGQRCQSGACVDACLGLHCPPPSVCRQGGCVVPCDGVVCDTGQVCENGRCQVACMCRACAEGYACSPDGTCQPGDCLGLTCAPGEVCESALTQEPGATARCIDPCNGAVCPTNQHCEAGRCVAGAPPPDAGVPDGGSGGDGGINPGGDGSISGDGSRGDGGDGGIFGTPRAGCGCAVPAGDSNGRTAGVMLGIALAGLAFASRRRRK
jgi:MYXO-CTERM domain-containing protein